MLAVIGILGVIGIIIAVVGGIWLLVVAFQESILWGIGSLIVPFVSLIFVCMFFEKAKKPFFIQLAGGAIIVGAMVAGGILGADKLSDAIPDTITITPTEDVQPADDVAPEPEDPDIATE